MDEFKHDKNGSSLPTSPLVSGVEAVSSLFFTRTHLWIKMIGRGILRIGIEPRLAALLLTPKAVILPRMGEGVHEGDVCMWVVLEGGTLPFTAPCDGVVSAVNGVVLLEPFEVSSNPLSRGWLIDVSPPNVQRVLAGLLTRGDAEALYARDEARLKELLQDEMRDRYPAVGLTLADGGPMLRSISEVLGPQRFFGIITTWLRGMEI